MQGEQTPESASGKQALFDLRRENFNLLSENRRLDLENQMFKAMAEGGEQRNREKQHWEE